MPARPRAECGVGVGAGGRASRRQAWEPQTARLEGSSASRCPSSPASASSTSPGPKLGREVCAAGLRRSRAGGVPRGVQRGRSAGGADEKPEGGLGAHGGWGCGRLPGLRGGCVSLTPRVGGGGEKGFFYFESI